MKLDSLAQNPLLKKLLRECDKGDVLFTEGTAANSVILILAGSLELTKKVGGHISVLGKVGAGEFIGEMALLQEQPFSRGATATATSRTTLLELGPQQFAQLESESPKLYTLLLKKAFKTIVNRNNKQEALNEILKGFNPKRRFIQFTHFLAKNGNKTPQGRVFCLEAESTSTQINCATSDITKWIEELIHLKLLLPKEAGVFLAPDESQLISVDVSAEPLSEVA